MYEKHWLRTLQCFERKEQGMKTNKERKKEKKKG
jgi:hypothetical protein